MRFRIGLTSFTVLLLNTTNSAELIDDNGFVIYNRDEIENWFQIRSSLYITRYNIIHITSEHAYYVRVFRMKLVLIM